MLKQINNSYCCVGLMSGTSLDGLDLVLCQLNNCNGTWNYELQKTKTIKYTEQWCNRLKGASALSGVELMRLNRRYGKWIGEQVLAFIEGENVEPDFVASHGHTLFHEPESEFNFQLGDGAMIAATTNITTVNDFRSLDVCLGGQGAPLVPIGDDYLFGDFDACVNLGGFANVSTLIDRQRRAWDICPVNSVLNRLVNVLNLDYDNAGSVGRSGKLIPDLLAKLNVIDYYQLPFPKSLGTEWLSSVFLPIVDEYASENVADILRTCYAHFALLIANDLNTVTKGKILCTGGGAYNTFLIEEIQSNLKGNLIVPDADLIEYKEALIFAFLGALRLSNKVNCLSSVTGALRDNCSGAIYYGK